MCEQIEQQFARLFFVDSSKINFTPIEKNILVQNMLVYCHKKELASCWHQWKEKKTKMFTSLTDLVDQPKFYIID